ncbi:transcriptional regulator [Methylovirgula ligni]|uniref:LysR family transcriptional regulator n=1 Tax=Methylovirgula ligni TaxID=569860 RepID=A0A3D9YPY0_9HYPH|nr:LysR substrate-binding domain-containing protein [Methylovirgula ligni]QAY96617.1 transcriptional regulator [Methylovirgula ligni]REF84068.1 LysR family transcriptional regulator [Methylovirgula ligni]
MNLQQLRSVLAAHRHRLNLTKAASDIFASQSSVSKQIRELETELGFDIFIRKGKRLISLTESGEQVISLIEQAVLATDNVKRFADQYSSDDGGRLVVAMANNLALHFLPPILQRFNRLYPRVTIDLLNTDSRQHFQSVMDGAADIALGSGEIETSSEMITFPAFTWRYVAIVPQNHELANAEALYFGDIAQYPIITYDPRMEGGRQARDAFLSAGLQPNIRITASDAAIIKEYVKLGLGVGIVSEIAINESDRQTLTVLPTQQSFGIRLAKIAIRRNKLLQSFAYRFIEALAPHLPQERIDRALRQGDIYTPSEIPSWPIWTQGLNGTFDVIDR